MQMRVFTSFLPLLLTTILLFSIHTPSDEAKSPIESEALISFSETNCQSSWQGNVNTYKIFDGSEEVGTSIWLSRGTKRVKAKYFAHKQRGQTVHDRYDAWRPGKNILLMSSGAYATGWDGKDVPAGVTVDNGMIVNREIDHRMDGLIIVEAVGGIRVSNIEDGNLRLASLGNAPMDIRNPIDKIKFLNWSVAEDATVFQTHLLIYKNQLKVASNGSRSSARRKFLILANDRNGDLYHVIFYLKKGQYTLYNGARAVLNYFNGKGMDIVAAVNLDTGAYDIISSGSGVKDCDNDLIEGTRNSYRRNLTNMLVYQFD